jgi:uncharacterized protein DUF6640
VPRLSSGRVPSSRQIRLEDGRAWVGQPPLGTPLLRMTIFTDDRGPIQKIGQRLLTGIAVATSVGGFLADFNRTHLFNPGWPAHARFHDAMTITLGSLLGGTSLYFLHRQHRDPQGDLTLAALLPAMFWAAQGAAFAFPGAGGLQAEFPQLVPRIRGVWIDERFFSGSLLALSAIGYAAARAAARGVPRPPITAEQIDWGDRGPGPCLC